MKRVLVLCMVLVAATGAVAEQEGETPQRFEISVESGLPSILSGPDLEDISNVVGRLGFSAGRNFQLTLTYARWEGTLARDDVLSAIFAEKYRDEVDSSTVFRDALLDRRDIELDQWEIGMVKTIPLGSPKWESFMGLGVGMQNAKADISWTGLLRDNQPLPPSESALPSNRSEDKNKFLTSVRGGIRYVPVPWLAAQLNLRVIPIADMFDEDYNAMELNAGVVFRFGRF